MGVNIFGKKIMKNLFEKPATAMYPVLKNDFYPITRGGIHIDAEKCIHCGMCERRCPTQALKVDRPDKTWQIDRSRCIVCNFCVQVCPTKCLRTEKEYAGTMTDKSTAIFLAKSPEKQPEEKKPEEANENLA